MLKGFANSGQYPQGYNYLKSIVESQPGYADDANLTNTANWLGKAAEINGDPDSVFGAFVRGETETVGSFLGQNIDDAAFQSASDNLANLVFNDVMGQGGIPTLDNIVASDVDTAVTDLHLPPWGWAGTWGDQLPPPFGLGHDFVQTPNDPVSWTESFLSQLAGGARIPAALARSLANEIGNALGDLLGKSAGGKGPGQSPFLPPPGSGGPPAGGGGVPGGMPAGAADDDFGDALPMISPLVIDLDGDGITLSALSDNSPYFDLTADGFARKTGWVGPREGILTYSPDGKSITDITQLFGSASVDGFTLLSRLDANGDHVIDASDPEFANLKVWIDSNGDGQSTPDELVSLASLGIKSIKLNATAVNQAVNGNSINLISSVTLNDGTTREIADVWFQNSPTFTRPTTSIEISADIAALPNLKGFGVLRDLQSTMMGDPTLAQLLRDFTATAPAGANYAAVENAVANILYRWAGVDGVAPSSRGGYIDARKLEFVERYLGQPFNTPNDGTLPGFRAASELNQAWTRVFDGSVARLALQSGIGGSLADYFQYDTADDLILPKSSFAASMQGLLASLGAPSAANIAAWDFALRVADASRIDLSIPDSVFHQVIDSGSNATIAALASAISDGLSYSIDAAGVISIKGSEINDTIYAPGGSSILIGNGGGNNFAATLAQNDTFRVGSWASNVEIVEHDTKTTQSTNTLLFDPGILPTNVSVSGTATGDIVLEAAGGPRVVLDGMISDAESGVDIVQFADGTVWTRKDVLGFLAARASTSGSDVIFGTTGADTLDGKGGGDLIQGFGGGDTILFNTGYGRLEINEDNGTTSAVNVLRLGAGITLPGLAAHGDASGNLVIETGAAGDEIVIDRMLLGTRYGIQRVDLADGSSLTVQQLLALATTGTSGADTLYGSNRADLIDGHGGTDVAHGGGGNDTFVYNAGYGALEIDEQDFATSAKNVLRFGTGITADSLSISFSGNDIVVTSGTAGDRIVLDGMLNWSYDGVQQFQFADGSTMSRQDILGRAHTIYGTAQGETLKGTSSADVFDGAGGNDIEIGGGGGDTFIFNAGYGHLEINESDFNAHPNNVLQLGTGIDPAQLTVRTSADGTGLVLSIGTGGDQVTLDNALSNAAYSGVQLVRFADGSSWTRAQLVQMATTGTTGADKLYGTSGADVFDGKGGGDTLIGRGGNDTFIFNAGYGSLEINEVDFAANANNVLKLGAGIDPSKVTVHTAADGYGLVLTDGISGDQITLDNVLSNAAYGVQSVQFADGTTWTRAQLVQMVTTGTTGADKLYGTSGADVFDGKGGGDTLIGRGGNDTFVYNAGYGNLEINEVDFAANANNVLKLGAGIDPSRVTVHTAADGYGLVLTDGISGDQITLDNVLSNAAYGVQSVQFADGTSWTRAQLVQMVTTGTAGADKLYGTPGADVFDGKGGNDVITGRGGNDTFIYNAGYGSLEINESDFASKPNNVLKLGAGIDPSKVIVHTAADGYGLVLTDGISGDQVTLDNVLSNAAYGVQSVQFADGTTWTRAQLVQMVTTGTTGADKLYGTPGADVFDGKGGNDVATGRGGNDTFIYNAGYGNLEINESDFASNPNNVLKLGTGIDPSKVIIRATTDGTGLVLTDGINGDQVTLDNLLSNAAYGVQSVQFADGTTWTRAQLRLMASTGTTGADKLYGTPGADVFDGKGGNDVITGRGGNDTFIYNAGYGNLEINESDFASNPNNVLQLGSGIDPSSVVVRTTTDGTGLVLTDGISGDQITLDSLLSNAAYGVQTVQFANGTSWTRAQLVQMVTTGTAGDDKLTGTPGADIFDGKGGNDIETGRGGNDTFIFNAGYGHLEISESDFASNPRNILQLGTGIDPASVTIRATADGTGLVLTDGIAGDQVTLDNLLSNAAYGVQAVQFADGTTWTRAQLVQMATTGTTGADKLYGTSGADVFDGKGGNDVATGRGGNDTFIFNAGYGHLEINESDFSANANNVLKLGAGIDPSKVTVHTGSDGYALVLTDGVSGDQVTLDNVLSNAAYGVQSMQFADGTTWTRAQLVQMATTGTAGADKLYGTPGADLFDGKGGNDVITGRGGNDTFVYNAGYGSLEINESDFASKPNNVLKLGAGIDPSKVTVHTGSDGYALVLTDGISGDQVTLDNVLSNAAYGVQSVQFADGTTWTRAQLVQMATTGTAGADKLYGTSGADVFDGKGGTDVITGRGGNDTYVMGRDYGSLRIVNGTAGSNTPAGVLSIGQAGSDNIWLEKSGNDLKIDVMGTTTSATIQGWYSNGYSKLADISVDGNGQGPLLLDQQVDQLVQAMASFSQSNPGFDPSSSQNGAITDASLLQLVHTAWHK
ncbi:beta strand repeat-containing protein [Burkholderia sp. ISTR5]|uniref:beta strand repeat-containing protein n=1 Tax=Burkholderia sp. ISTR5 TaxID=2500161 RepID=UPI001369505A|nr:calcium-binding protein [Burkholderia sp. ISTR5]NBI44124.1 hemolysin [Burkholderia sp. ISTR5]